MQREKNVKTYKDFVREAIHRDPRNYGYLQRYVNSNNSEHGITAFSVMTKIKPKKDYAHI